MANTCMTLTKGRKIACKGGNGGIKAVGFVPFEENLITGTAGEIPTFPAIGVIPKVFRYLLKNSGNLYTEEITADSDARTVLYTGNLSVVLQKLDLETRNEIKMLAMSEVICFIETNNGEIFVVGAGNGMELSGGSTAETGGNKGDFYGSKLTFTSLENEPYMRLSTAAKLAYATAATAGGM